MHIRTKMGNLTTKKLWKCKMLIPRNSYLCTLTHNCNASFNVFFLFKVNDGLHALYLFNLIISIYLLIFLLFLPRFSILINRRLLYTCYKIKLLIELKNVEDGTQNAWRLAVELRFVVRTVCRQALWLHTVQTTTANHHGRFYIHPWHLCPSNFPLYFTANTHWPDTNTHRFLHSVS